MAPRKVKVGKATAAETVKKVPTRNAPQPKKSALKSVPAPAPEAEAEAESVEEEEVSEQEKEDDDEEDDDEAVDSSDEEQEDDDASELELDVETLPKVAQEATVQAKLTKAKKPANKPGVVYIGRLPRGFEETQLKAYFEQFGQINRLRLSRNKKTGRSKHYAFIEFKHASVADIVAETMDNYLLVGHILACKVLPQDEIHPKLWAGAGKRFRVMPKNRLVRQKHNEPKTIEKQEAIAKRRVQRDSKKRKRLSELGIDYDFDGYTTLNATTKDAVTDVSEEAAPKTKKAKASETKETPKSKAVVAPKAKAVETAAAENQKAITKKQKGKKSKK